jgi:shikimate dehydrogenase
MRPIFWYLGAMPKINGKTKLLGVFGCPVSHSLSPVMHNALLDALGIDAVYLPLPCSPEQLPQAVAGFRALGFVGANVTIPFKEAMVHLVDELTPIAKFMGSVNTLFWKEGKLCGTTTDSYGALQNLAENGVSLQGRKVALLGNGGASRALAFALLDPAAAVRPASVTLFGRDLNKVQALSADLRAVGLGSGPQLDFSTLDQFPERATEFDLLINGTSVGMAPHLEEIPVPPQALHGGMVVYDIVYTPAETRLLREAKAIGCKVVPGMGMLVHQGALSFANFWFPQYSTRVDTQIMRNAIEAFRNGK